MGRIMGLLLIVVGIWIGIEVYQKGTREAFDGAFSFFDTDEFEVRDGRTTPQRAGDAARRAHELGDERRNRLLGD